MQATQIEGFRLSPQQKRIWLLEKGQNVSLRVQGAVSIVGKLNIDVLKTALQNLVNRHEIFRTTFCRLPEMEIPVQAIADNYEIGITELNLQDLSEQEQESQIIELFERLKEISFNLANQPPIQAYILCLGSDKYTLILNLSALIADVYTLKHLADKISIYYSACLQGHKLDDDPLQYADIAEWQNQILESAESELGKEYWRKQDIAAINDFNLWFEEQTTKDSFQPQYVYSIIDSNTVEKLELLSSKYQVNSANILLSCWLILLSKITRQSDLCVGVVGNGRKYAELDQAVGILSKYLPIACHLQPETKFSELLQQLHNSVNNAWEWQEYFTWEETVKSADFCPVAFEFTDLRENYSVAGLSFSLSKYYSCIDKFKIKLTCLHQDNALITELHFDDQLYRLEDIETLAEQFQTVLADAIANPETAISQLNILSDRQLQQLLVEFNQTSISHPPDRCIHQLFEEQVNRTPDAIALVFEQQQLTYAQLNARANQLAHYLRSLGVGREVLVGLYTERSLEMIIGLLGILKAGGAYIPLDPNYPHQRLAQMLADAQVRVLVTQQQLLKELPQHPPEVICLDTDFETIAQQSHENLQTEVKPENLIYVLFTSGSTGKPKGVAVEHRQLCNYLNGIGAKIDFSTCRSFAHVATFAADLGNTTIFPALCNGGCLHIISQERATNSEALGEYFERHTIDCLKIVPAHLAALLTSGSQKILPQQRLILGGEACSWQLIEQIQQLAPNCQIFNHYGPTETTVGVLTYPIQNRTDCATVPMGKAIANTQIYLLDSHLQPVPIGVPGELYIGGDSLARGYLNLPELTVEKFIANPFNREHGKASSSHRLYKTGDLARYLRDGNIEFLGRIDEQVKIRGFRIELEEIRLALQQHPTVQQAIVCSREDVPGDKRLVAYIVFEPSAILHPQSSDLRAFLKEKLPEYMVLSAFVMLKTLPLTANGKIDREKLPAPEQVPPELAATFVAPRNQTEEAIAQIWAEVLAVKQVGIYDNFFELGGHSLIATQVISRLRQSLHVELPLRQFFDSPTVADLAVIVAQNLAEQTDEATLAEALAELDELSEEESQAVLAQGEIE
ncbi:non-ribosomal peptide synthetase [Aliterella atlantica]|uniref:Amino acid adenylation protein n=1 Tax=Aliterella atlantica CENA595 TaxID=1618023 RepID=A0A0D8ZQK9_9CYAN|nr:non-ribosomal peptide synthetase [Aliterella atlantica]KJH70637.1 amino acid adenylation protein [Aliterella atlantica CENA595]